MRASPIIIRAMVDPGAVDKLPPEARFAIRALAAGLPMDEAGALLRTDAAGVRKELRSAARGCGTSTPSPSEGDAALLAALEPVIAAARATPTRAPSKLCPTPDIAVALASGGLDGPLLLAEIEHAADCPKCLARLIELRRSGATQAPRAARARQSRWPVVVGVVVGLAAAAWYLFH